ncbi:MAG: hypothetical protein WCK65_05580 [Rhodospirillaceae bacterium]
MPDTDRECITVLSALSACPALTPNGHAPDVVINDVIAEDFELACDWRGSDGHPHLSIGYVVLAEETVWGVYACSATNVTSGNEWSFTLPTTFTIHEATNIALNIIAWDRFVVIESERHHYDEAAKHAIATSLHQVSDFSRPCKLVEAVRVFLS